MIHTEHVTGLESTCVESMHWLLAHVTSDTQKVVVPSQINM